MAEDQNVTRKCHCAHLEAKNSQIAGDFAGIAELARRQGFKPRYRGPEAVQETSMILGRVVFVRKIARIVGPSPAGGGPFACKVSSFFQEFSATGSNSTKLDYASPIVGHERLASRADGGDKLKCIRCLHACRCSELRSGSQLIV
jgi:hypothetical protein